MGGIGKGLFARIKIEELREKPLCESVGEPLAMQLFHILLRSRNWSADERPTRYPEWRPEDVGYHFKNFFAKSVEPKDVEKAFCDLQEEGVVESLDGGESFRLSSWVAS